MLVAEKLSEDSGVTLVRPEPTSLIWRALYRCDLFVERVLNVAGPQNLYSVLWWCLLTQKAFRNADLIHLHNLHWHSRNFPLMLPLLLGQRFPVVWTFHDMWPITGHCISSRDCERWINGCGGCPYPRTYLGQIYDSSRLQCRLKRWIYSKADFTVVTPSRWLAERVRLGNVIRNKQIRTIPNSIDPCFRPLDKIKARLQLGLSDPAMPAILFVSAFLDDPIKGYPYFEKALCQLHDAGRIPEVQLLLVGRGKAGRQLKSRFPLIELGYIDNSQRMAEIYAASDLYIMPSISDNLPSVILESMACGTAVACFDTGGIPEMVQHQVTGYVAKKGDVEDLSRGIEQIIGDLSRADDMGRAGAARVADCFSSVTQVAAYLDLYNEITEKPSEHA